MYNQKSTPFDPFYDAASVRLPKCSTPVKALRFAPTSAPSPPCPASCAALTQRALWKVSPHRRGRGRGAAADGRQARHAAGGLTVGRREGRGDRLGSSSREGHHLAPYGFSRCLRVLRRIVWMGMILVSPCRCLSSSRGVGPAGVGTSASRSSSS